MPDLPTKTPFLVTLGEFCLCIVGHGMAPHAPVIVNTMTLEICSGAVAALCGIACKRPSGISDGPPVEICTADDIEPRLGLDRTEYGANLCIDTSSNILRTAVGLRRPMRRTTEVDLRNTHGANSSCPFYDGALATTLKGQAGEPGVVEGGYKILCVTAILRVFRHGWNSNSTSIVGVNGKEVHALVAPRPAPARMSGRPGQVASLLEKRVMILESRPLAATRIAHHGECGICSKS